MIKKILSVKFLILFLGMFIAGFIIGYTYSISTSKEPQAENTEIVDLEEG